MVLAPTKGSITCDVSDVELTEVSVDEFVLCRNTKLEDDVSIEKAEIAFVPVGTVELRDSWSVSR